MERLYVRVVSPKMTVLPLESGSHASVFEHTHTRKESMVSMTGFVRSLFTMRIDLTCSAFVLSS